MDGVDRFNRSIKSFNLKRPSKKWDGKLSVFIVEVILPNSFLLYRPKEEKRYTRTDLLEEISKYLLDWDSMNSNEPIHFCDQSKTYNRCVICYKKGMRKTTTHFCTTCRTYLHAGVCFKEFHSKDNTDTDQSYSYNCRENLESIGISQIESTHKHNKISLGMDEKNKSQDINDPETTKLDLESWLGGDMEKD